MALAKHGDLAGAVAKFKDANQKGPYWADPLKAWGDVLAKQGSTKEAVAKYDEALKYAPSNARIRVISTVDIGCAVCGSLAGVSFEIGET